MKKFLILSLMMIGCIFGKTNFTEKQIVIRENLMRKGYDKESIEEGMMECEDCEEFDIEEIIDELEDEENKATEVVYAEQSDEEDNN